MPRRTPRQLKRRRMNECFMAYRKKSGGENASAVSFINNIPSSNSLKMTELKAGRGEHQCDKRLLHSIQESIRNVYAYEINLSCGTSCNITNFMKYGELLMCTPATLWKGRERKKLHKCEGEQKKKPIVPGGTFCQWANVYVFSSASNRSSLFESAPFFLVKLFTERKIIYISCAEWFLLRSQLSFSTYMYIFRYVGLAWFNLLLSHGNLSFSLRFQLITLCGVNTKKENPYLT
jgi:hypothetical protein